MHSMGPLHVLLIRFSSLGDVVLTSSVISALKHRWGKNIFLSYLTSSPFVPLLEKHKDVDAIYGFSRKRGWQGLKELKQMVEEIHQQRPIHLMLDLHGSLR